MSGLSCFRYSPGNCARSCANIKALIYIGDLGVWHTSTVKMDQISHEKRNTSPIASHDDSHTHIKISPSNRASVPAPQNPNKTAIFAGTVPGTLQSAKPIPGAIRFREGTE
jgi:hypothetical protein